MAGLADKPLFGLIHDFLKVYLPKQRRCSHNTISAYRESLEQFIDFAKVENRVPIQDVTFEMLDAKAVTRFLDALEQERGCGISTRNHRLAAIRAFFTYAAAMDISAVAFLTELKKVPMKKPVEVTVVEHMSEEAVQAVLAQPDTATSKGLRDRFFMILMYDTGARIQEMIDIRLCDLRLSKTPTVTLRGKGNKIRSVPLMERTTEHLRQYLEVFHVDSPENAQINLFYLVSHKEPHPLSHDCISKLVKKYGAMARKICPEVPRNVHPHLFRHSRAMHLYQHGMDLTLVAQWLGHANLETTRVYAHADTELKRKAIASASEQNGPLRSALNPSRFTVTDEDTLKRLYGLK